ncbi:TetR/AcrR family transcriptional regulator [Streptomyces niveus]|uniref:TetR/AcrR family transcriptional regulator n=1 Tax=Streptomyces niveus TaxID=193462 RepID=UPI00340A695C
MVDQVGSSRGRELEAAGKPARAPRKGLKEKREAIQGGARTVFGREGYTRASIDAIAAEAGVSTRTIYNHFTDKEELFGSVFLESTASVTAASLELLDRHLRKLRRVEDVEADFLAYARDWVGQGSEHPDHFALVRQIVTEGSRMPAAVIDEWQRTGPRAVRGNLARRLRELADAGLLDIAAGAEAAAARHLGLLVGGVMLETYFGALPMGADETEEYVRGAVWAFLKLYGVPGGGADE